MFGLAHDLHQSRIGLDRRKVFGLDLSGPDAAIDGGLFQGSRHDAALIDAKETLGVGHAQRPGRHQNPVTDRKQEGERQEEIDRTRDRRVQFLDAVPFMAGGEIAGVDVALLPLYRHGVSSSSRMDFAARSNRGLFDGQYV
jgi:hypothetical protein